MWANSTMGVEALLPFKSSASQASCSAPNEPIPPALRFATLTSPTKWTPLLSNEYQPVPLAWVLLPLRSRVGRAGILIDDVMFAGDVESVEFCPADDLIGIVEFLGLRQVSYVARMDHECGLLRQSIHFGDGFFQRRERVRVWRLFEADVAVGDLQEGESTRCLGLCLGDPEQRRPWHAASDRPQHSGARPDHAFQRIAAVDVVPFGFRHPVSSASTRVAKLKPMGTSFGSRHRQQ